MDWNSWWLHSFPSTCWAVALSSCSTSSVNEAISAGWSWVPPAPAPQRATSEPWAPLGLPHPCPPTPPLLAPAPTPASLPLLSWPWPEQAPPRPLPPGAPPVGPHLPWKSPSQAGTRSWEYRLLPASGSTPPEALATSPAPHQSPRARGGADGAPVRAGPVPRRCTYCLPTSAGAAEGGGHRPLGLFIPGIFHFFSIDQTANLEHSRHSAAVDFMNEEKTEEKWWQVGGREVKKKKGGEGREKFLYHRPCLGSDCVPGSAAAAFGVLLYSNPHSDPCETMVMVAQMSSLPRTWSRGPLTQHLELPRLPPSPQSRAQAC